MQGEEREIKQEEKETGTKTLSGRQRKKDKHLLRNRNSVYFIHISIVRIAGEYLTVYNTKSLYSPLLKSVFSLFRYLINSRQEKRLIYLQIPIDLNRKRMKASNPFVSRRNLDPLSLGSLAFSPRPPSFFFSYLPCSLLSPPIFLPKRINKGPRFSNIIAPKRENIGNRLTKTVSIGIDD